MPRSAQSTAALMVRGSSPSGSTMRFFAARASSVNWKRNAGGDKRRKRVESATKLLIKSALKCWLVYCLMFSIRSLSSTGTSRLKFCKFNAVCQVLPSIRKIGNFAFSKAGWQSLLI